MASCASQTVCPAGPTGANSRGAPNIFAASRLASLELACAGWRGGWQVKLLIKWLCGEETASWLPRLMLMLHRFIDLSDAKNFKLRYHKCAHFNISKANYLMFRTNFLEAWSNSSQSEYELQLQFQSKIKFYEFFSLQNLNFSALFAFLDRHLSDKVFW